MKKTFDASTRGLTLVEVLVALVLLALALAMARDASHFGVEDHIPDFSPEATDPTAPVQVETLPAAPRRTPFIEAGPRAANHQQMQILMRGDHLV